MTKLALTLAALIVAGNELQALMGMNPEFDPAASQEEIESWLKNATGYDKKGEPFIASKTDRFTPETQAVIDKFNPKLYGKIEEPIETASPVEVTDDLKSEIASTDRLRDLKDIATEYDEFKPIRGQLSAFKTVEDLKAKMLEVLENSSSPPKGKPEKEEEVKKDPEEEGLPKKDPEEKSIAPPPKNKSTGEATMAQFIDTVLLAGGTWEGLIETCQIEATKRGYKIPVTRSALNTHLKYRMAKNAEYLGKLKITKEGIG